MYTHMGIQWVRMKPATHLHLVPGLRMCVDRLPLSHASSLCGAYVLEQLCPSCMCENQAFLFTYVSFIPDVLYKFIKQAV